MSTAQIVAIAWPLCSIIAVLVLKKGGAPDESWGFFLKDVFVTNFGWWPVLLLLGGPFALAVLLALIGAVIFAIVFSEDG